MKAVRLVDLERAGEVEGKDYKVPFPLAGVEYVDFTLK